MENLRETNTEKESTAKRKRSPSPDQKSCKKKIENYYDQALSNNKIMPQVFKKLESQIASEEESEEDYSKYDNYIDTFNQNKSSYVRLSKPQTDSKNNIKISQPIPYQTASKSFKNIAPDNILPESVQTETKKLFQNPNSSTCIPGPERNSINPKALIKPQNNKIPTKKKPQNPEKLSFCEKYAPTELKYMGSTRSSCMKLEKWFKSLSLPNTPKAVLLSGPPGTGKTTASKMVAGHLNYSIIEFNASDCRNKQMIQEKIRPFVCNTSIIDSDKVGKSVLVMDEVDGMLGGDEGGISALIDCIKLSKIPIICICNDRYCTSIKSLSKHCLDIKFTKIPSWDIQKVIKNIVAQEKIKLTEEETLKLAISANGDFRSAINMLELSQKNQFFICDKDKTNSLNVFEISDWIINDKIDPYDKNYLNKKLDNKISLFLSDYDMVSSFIIENYINFCTPMDQDIQDSPRSLETLKEISKASETLAYSDTVHTKIYKDQDWSLLLDFASLNLYAASFSVQSDYRVQFPSHIGKSSTIKKNQKLLQEFKNSILSATAGCDDQNAFDYRQILLEKFVSEDHCEEKDSLAQCYRIDKRVAKECMTPFVHKDLAKSFEKIAKKNIGWLRAGTSAKEHNTEDESN